MFPLSINNYAELTAFLISAIAYRNLKGSPIRLFPFFLLFIVLVELLGRYIKYHLGESNAWLYNISTTVEFLFYAYIFSAMLKDPGHKKIAHWFMLVFPGLVLVNLIFIQGFKNFHSYTMVIGSICMVLLCCLFFYELLLNPVEELRRTPMFWISTGILFFYLGDVTYNLLYNLVIRYGGDMGRKLFLSINNNLILMLYSCFIMGFLCRRNLRRSLSQ